MPPDEEAQPESYEPSPPRHQQETTEEERGDAPTEEELDAHNERIAGVRKPMGPPAPERPHAADEDAPAPDVPEAPPPASPDE